MRNLDTDSRRVVSKAMLDGQAFVESRVERMDFEVEFEEE
jgi:hypothetical protein